MVSIGGVREWGPCASCSGPSPVLSAPTPMQAGALAMTTSCAACSSTWWPLCSAATTPAARPLHCPGSSPSLRSGSETDAARRRMWQEAARWRCTARLRYSPAVLRYNTVGRRYNVGLPMRQVAQELPETIDGTRRLVWRRSSAPHSRGDPRGWPVPWACLPPLHVAAAAAGVVSAEVAVRGCPPARCRLIPRRF